MKWVRVWGSRRKKRREVAEERMKDGVDLFLALRKLRPNSLLRVSSDFSRILPLPLTASYTFYFGLRYNRAYAFLLQE